MSDAEMAKQRRVHIHMPTKDWVRLREMAQRRGDTVSNLVRYAVDRVWLEQPIDKA
jgi:macrodomain Ter protein organizer (MatP/YcbG family)